MMFFFFQSEDGIRDSSVTGVQTCALPISLPALLQLFKGGANRGSATPAAQIRGNAEIANMYRELFVLARPDPEEELSRWLGDFAARRLSQFARRAIEAARH